jgi:transporter family-2 protein
MSGIMLAQKLGSGVFTGISVTAAIVTSIALDHFGWIGFKQHPASWPRMLGGGLMITGLWLVSRF